MPTHTLKKSPPPKSKPLQVDILDKAEAHKVALERALEDNKLPMTAGIRDALTHARDFMAAVLANPPANYRNFHDLSMVLLQATQELGAAIKQRDHWKAATLQKVQALDAIRATRVDAIVDMKRVITLLQS